MDLFNYDNFSGIHAIAAYWNQGNIIISLLLCAFYLLLLAFLLLILLLIVNDLNILHFERKKTNFSKEDKHE